MMGPEASVKSDLDYLDQRRRERDRTRKATARKRQADVREAKDDVDAWAKCYELDRRAQSWAQLSGGFVLASCAGHPLCLGSQVCSHYQHIAHAWLLLAAIACQARFIACIERSWIACVA